jgi:ribosomal protein L9
MELINTFVPATIDFARQPIEHEKADTRAGSGATGAADILMAASMASKPKAANGIYGSVSTADVVATIKSALAHNDEAARVLLSEHDVRFVGHEEDDATRVKQLGTFRAEIQIPGAALPLVRNIRVRAKKEE